MEKNVNNDMMELSRERRTDRKGEREAERGRRKKIQVGNKGIICCELLPLM